VIEVAAQNLECARLVRDGRPQWPPANKHTGEENEGEMDWIGGGGWVHFFGRVGGMNRLSSQQILGLQINLDSEQGFSNQVVLPASAIIGDGHGG
jgi:hypothetical protein